MYHYWYSHQTIVFFRVQNVPQRGIDFSGPPPGGVKSNACRQHEHVQSPFPSYSQDQEAGSTEGIRGSVLVKAGPAQSLC